MSLSALHMDRVKPAGAQNLCDAPRVVPFGFVSHRRKRSIDLACLHADDIEPHAGQAKEQVLAQRSCLKANAFDWMPKGC